MRKYLQRFKQDGNDILSTFSGDEVMLKDLFLILWNRKGIVVIGMLFFVIVAFISIITTPHSFISSSTYITEGNTTDQKVAGGFAELLGFSGGSLTPGGSGTFADPGFYPTIVASQPFLLDLIKERLYFRVFGDSLTLEAFVLKYDSRNFLDKALQPIKSLPLKILDLVDPKPQTQVSDSVYAPSEVTEDTLFQLQRLSKREITAMKLLSERIEIDGNGNLIVVTTKLPDAVACAQLNRMVSQRLLDFIITRQTEKERRELDFISRRMMSAKNNFEGSQQALAAFRDRNRGVISETAKTEEEKLQSEYSIDFQIYQKLATEIEEKRIALEEKTPVYTVFEPTYVPVEPESKGTIKKLVVFSILGAFCGLLVITIIIVRTLLKREVVT